MIRLLERWCPEVVTRCAARARGLAALIGRRDSGTVDFIAYSLAGQAITPPGTSYSVADNLIWALGAYVEKKGRESNRSYLLQ